jgi:hypothetical protein
MAGRNALIMSNRHAEELREYLRRPHAQTIPEFDDFLGQVDTLYRLRLKAEERFKTRKYIAESRRGALPLDWLEINAIVNPEAAAPPETLITKISRECLIDTEEILGNLRKVLIREREKMSLGMVQQVDAHCLRWLCRQPGHDAIEKAGAKQRILAIVRRENYNTLENRVFKDFLMRCSQETAQYLRINQSKFPDHENIKCVRRLHNLCEKGMREPLLEKVGVIRALPVPNYVLRQERCYAKIWKAYVELIRQANIAERLWAQREEVKATLVRLRKETQKHINPQAKYHCPIWFNALDGRHSILDNPFYENELGAVRVAESNGRGDDIIIDLTGGTLRWDLLIYGKHDNASPYIQDYQKPSIEDLDNSVRYFLNDLLSKQDVNDEKLRKHLSDYFTQLHGRLGGIRWFILVPDSWNALWQETIIKSIPLARNNVFLLWRSIAAVLGSADKLQNPHENDTVVVVNSQMTGVISLSQLTLVANQTGTELIPQRKSYNRHKECYLDLPMSLQIKANPKEAFLWGVKNKYILDNQALGRIRKFIDSARHVILVNCNNVALSSLQGITVDGMTLEKGVKRFINKQRQGQTAYYDEMEALSLIVQTADERVMAKPLVEADEKFPGGREKSIDEIRDAARIKQGSDYVNLFLCMGEATPDAPLKIKKHLFKNTLDEDHAIHIRARMKPGQGMAVVTIASDFLREPIELDFLSNMTDSDEKNRRLTVSIIENEMERSFPPDSPHVVADYDLWVSGSTGTQEIKRNIGKYLAGQIAPDGTWFAQATPLYPKYEPLPSGLSPLERLRRKNVFGNDPKKRLPFQPSNMMFQDNFNFDALFKKLADDYNRAENDQRTRDQLTRLIAWTYQSEFAGFMPIRRQILRRVLGYAKGTARQAPLFQELTLCANLCNSVDEWTTCLEAVRLRISNYDNNVSRDFYLLYNLLQFHPTIIRDTGNAITNKCWQWVKHIPHWYENYHNSPNSIGYILKSILYFLRCRRFDGKVFLTQERDNEHYKEISDCLKQKVHFQHEKLRLLVIEYLNNKGTIDGLPVD